MAKVQREIVLRQLVGVGEDGSEVRHAVDEIFLNGVRVGYAGHQPTDPINFIRPGVLTDGPTVAAIRGEVATKLGGTRKINGVPEMVDEGELDRDEGLAPTDDE